MGAGTKPEPLSHLVGTKARALPFYTDGDSSAFRRAPVFFTERIIYVLFRLWEPNRAGAEFL
jgi:hypothetical protein